MSTPTMNHGSHTQQQIEQQQHQQQTMQINEIQPTHSNLANSPLATLTRSDSTSTVILEEEETRTSHRNGTTVVPPALLASLSAQLRSLMKTGGLFNTDMETSDKLKEFFASGNGFALERLLSEVDARDFNLNADDLLKLDSFKFDGRTLSEFIRSESFDQLIASTAPNTDGLIHPQANSSSTSFSELRSVSFDLKKDSNHSSLFTPINSFGIPTTIQPQQGALNAIQHDHAFLAKRNPADETTSSSSSTTMSKRTQGRRSARISSRIQTRAIRTSTAAAAATTTSDSSSTKIKRGRNVNRANDVQTSDDLNYYLERRRKNNEASKISRAIRKQKFGNMDEKCSEYERVNMELQMKITTLEKVTASLKNGLVNNFQRKN